MMPDMSVIETVLNVSKALHYGVSSALLLPATCLVGLSNGDFFPPPP